MRSKIDPETMKIQAPGAVLEPSGDPLGGLGVSGGASADGGKRSMALAIGDWSFSSVSKHEWL